MSALTGIIFLLMAFVGVRALIEYEEAITADECYQTYLEKTRSTGITCREKVRCAECIGRVGGYFNKIITENDVDEYDSYVRRYLNPSKSSCRLDIELVIKAWKQDLLGQVAVWLGWELKQTPPAELTTMGFGDDDHKNQEDRGKNECLENLIKATRYGKIPCSVATEYIKCLVRAQRLHVINLARLQIYQTEIRIKVVLVSMQIYCTIDLESIIDEVKGEPTEVYNPTTQPSYIPTTQPSYEPTTQPPYVPTTTRRWYEPETTTTKESPYVPTTTRKWYEPETTTKETPYVPARKTTRRWYKPTTQPPYVPTTKTTRRWYAPKTTRRTTTPRPNNSNGDCLDFTTSCCYGVSDGDYPTCLPRCQDGAYITCTNEYAILRYCPLGFFGAKDKLFLASKVFDPYTSQCERSTTNCPRPLDNQITPDY